MGTLILGLYLPYLYAKVVANILSKGTTLREYTKGVENNLRQVELDSIQVCCNNTLNTVLSVFFLFEIGICLCVFITWEFELFGCSSLDV